MRWALLLASVGCVGEGAADTAPPAPTTCPGDPVDGYGGADVALLDGFVEGGAVNVALGRVPQVHIEHLIAYHHPGNMTAWDADGDGNPDIAVTTEDEVRVFLGPFAREDCNRVSSDGIAIRTTDYAATVDAAGDVDGDGFADLVVSEDTAGAHVIRGPVGGPLDVVDDPRVTSFWLPEGPPYAWAHIGGSGDMTEDGLDDVILAITREDDSERGYSGEITLLPGPVDGGVHDLGPTWTTDGAVGDPVNGVGDLTADGLPDVAMNLWHDKGVTLVLLSEVPPGTVPLSEAGVHIAAASLAQSPQSMSAADNAGDLNADGHPDLAVTYVGGVAVFFGPLPEQGDVDLAELDLVVAWDDYTEFARRGDANGDGYDDLAIASLMYQGPDTCIDGGIPIDFLVCGPSAIGLMAGPIDAAVYEPPDIIWTNQSYAEFGSSMIGDVDFDGDGSPELVAWDDHRVDILFGI